MKPGTHLSKWLPFVLCATLACQAVCVGEETAKVLLIGKQPDHPHGTHMYLHVCQVLAKCLAQNASGIETVVSDGWPSDPDVLLGVKTIVVYTNPAAELLLGGPHRDHFAELMEQGVGLVTIHWASTVRKENFQRLAPQWVQYLGGTWISNVGIHTGKSELKQLDGQHPVCRGWEQYEIRDEFYLNPLVTDRGYAVLEVTVEGEPVVVGWSLNRDDGGRSFATTLGHFYDNFQREPFRRMIVNAILWTAGLKFSQAGANVDLSEQDLALPPDPGKK